MNGIKRLIGLLLAGSVLIASFGAMAGFDEALEAYRGKDYPKAFSEARLAADKGDPRAFLLLGVLYQGGLGVPVNLQEAASWYEKAAKAGAQGAYAKLAQMLARGEGVPKDDDLALAYARKSANLGDAEGMFLVHTILKATSLRYLDANGKADQAKYNALATRPSSGRDVDREAHDNLYRASEKGLPLAVLTNALMFGGTLGDKNRERMLSLAARIPKHGYKPLEAYEMIARHMGTLGQSLASPQLFYDSQLSQAISAVIATCGLGESKDAIKAAPPSLTAISVVKPLSGAVYLPSRVPGYERAYLLAGEWEEDWVYKGCDRVGTVRVKFVADGLGGARMSSTQSGKDVRGLQGQ